MAIGKDAVNCMAIGKDAVNCMAIGKDAVNCMAIGKDAQFFADRLSKLSQISNNLTQ